MMKYFFALIMMMVFAVPAAQAETGEPGYVVAGTHVVPDVDVSNGFAAIATANRERTWSDATIVTKKAPAYSVYNLVTSIGPGSGGVSGGGTIGAIRS